MSPPDIRPEAIHPEALLDRARRGSLGQEEQRLLDKHLRRCSACRLELSLGPGLYAHIALSPEDDALVARALARTVARPWYVRRFGSPFTRRVLLAFAALAIVSIASAAVYSRRMRAVPSPGVTPVVQPNVPVAQPESHPASDVEPQGAPIVPPVTIPSSKPKSTLAARAPEPTCADLFRKANQARRDGAAEEAISLYRDLDGSCMGSTEEISSRVLVGRIYLDRLSDSRRALEAFDSYLAAGTSGPLREDALIGRALALGKLGRSSEEKRAWNTLLAAYPDSIYAEKAKARLNEIP